jgi:Tol biopolymer transport system component
VIRQHVPLHSMTLLFALASCTGESTGPRPDPLEGRIAFTAWSETMDTISLYTVRPDGSDLKRLLTGQASRHGLSWSPSGSQLVFLYNSTNFVAEAEIRVVNADGTGEHTILGPGSFYDPDWSPRGDRIALSQHLADGSQRLFTIKPDGTDLTVVGTRANYDFSPVWSPDGQQLAFAGNCETAGCNRFVMDLWVVNADGTNPRRLTSGIEIDDDVRDPAWSPDGEWIAFGMQRGFSTDVYRISATGQDLEKLTFSSSTISYLSPTYSPEGDQLAYSEWRPWTSTTFLYVANADGTDPVRLPLSVGNAQSVAWSR